MDADIKAAQDAGGKGMLLMTGKTSRDILSKSNVKPDHVAMNLKEATGLIIKAT